MLRPYLTKLTISEFNCFLVGGHATIAGFMFGLLILYGVISICKLCLPVINEISSSKSSSSGSESRKSSGSASNSSGGSSQM